jgi:TonB family protein
MNKYFLAFAFVFFPLVSISAQSEPKQINGGILNGKATSIPKPEYPEAAKAAGHEGVVYVKVTIDEAGNVVSAVSDDQVRKVYKASKEGESVADEQPVADILLRDAAERAAWNAKFSPTRLNGVGVRVSGTIVYNFVAGKGDDAVSEEAVSTSGSGPVAGGVLNSKAVTLPKPLYPAAARAVRAEGAVNVQVTVDEAGNVIAATAVSGHPLLRAASVNAAREAKFSPTMLSGQPVRFTGVVVYNFVAPSVEN